MHRARSRTTSCPSAACCASRPRPSASVRSGSARALGGDLEHAHVHRCESVVGGGSMPGTAIASWGVRLTVPDPAAFAARLRAGSPAVFCRVEDDHVLFDLRTVPEDQVPDLARAILYALEGDDFLEGLTGLQVARSRDGKRSRGCPHGRTGRCAVTGRRDGRTRRPRQVLADRRASPASTPTAGTRRSAAGSRSTSATRGARCRAAARSASSTFRATSGSSATCSRASVRSGRCCSWWPPTKDGSPSPRSTCRSSTSWASGPAVVALTKRDLVDEETARDRHRGGPRAARRHGARRRADRAGVSASTGDGIDDTPGGARRRCSSGVPPPDAGSDAAAHRPGLHDQGRGHRGDRHPHRRLPRGRRRGRRCCPSNRRARIRSLQTHRTADDRACPVSRVAANLVGVERDELARGDVLADPARGGPPTDSRRTLRPVRGLRHAVTARGAYKVYAGAAEVDARIRVYGGGPMLEPARTRSSRIHTSSPLVLDVCDRFVRARGGQAGNRGRRPGARCRPSGARRPCTRRAARAYERAATGTPCPRCSRTNAARSERSTLRCSPGRGAPGGTVVGGWFVRPGLFDEVERTVTARSAPITRRTRWRRAPRSAPSAPR